MVNLKKSWLITAEGNSLQELIKFDKSNEKPYETSYVK